MTKQYYQQWLYARIAAHGMYIIPYAANVAITEASWQSKKKRPFKKKAL
jgi:hypothetical protein